MTDILAAIEAAIAEDERTTCRDGHLGRRARGLRQIEARREILKLHGLAPRRPGGVRPGLMPVYLRLVCDVEQRMGLHRRKRLPSPPLRPLAVAASAALA